MKTRILFLLFIITFMTYVVTFNDAVFESQLWTLEERIEFVERQLREDIALLRQEFGLDLSEKEEINKVNESDETVSLRTLENMETDILTKFSTLLDGFHSEKIWRRDVQHQLQHAQQKIEGITQVITEIERKIHFHLKQMSFKPIGDKFDEMINILRETKGSISKAAERPAVDCLDLYKRGHLTSGVYTIFPTTMWRPLQVYCDMDTDGGGWTVFQRRCDGSVNFTRSWEDYRFGFGNMSTEFWLGNEYVSRMTSYPHELRIDLEDFEDARRYAKYSNFELAPSKEQFVLTVDGYSGNAGDSLTRHKNREFSTFDKGPLAQSVKTKYKGGFWISFYYIHNHVNLNGLYMMGKYDSPAEGVYWSGFRDIGYSLKFTEMKFRSK